MDAKEKIDGLVERMKFLGSRDLDGEVDCDEVAECLLELAKVVQYLVDQSNNPFRLGGMF